MSEHSGCADSGGFCLGSQPEECGKGESWEVVLDETDFFKDFSFFFPKQKLEDVPLVKKIFHLSTRKYFGLEAL